MNWQRQISIGNEMSYLIFLSSTFILVGILSQVFLLVFVGVLFLLFVFLNKYYLRHVGNKIIISVDKDTVKLFKGEESDFSLTLNQEGLLPIFNGHIRMTIDHVVGFKNERKVLETEQIELTLPLTLFGRQAFTTTLPFEGKQRGVAKIRKLEIRIPHLFGFGEAYLRYLKPVNFETIIYSSPETVGGIEKIVPKNQGEYPIRSSFFEDMTAIVGTRSYVPTDPFNRVHWKASARTNQLQTKLFDKTAQFSWTIIINVRERKLEKYLSGLTYLLETATVKNIPFEVFVNVRRAGKTPYIHLPLGVGKEHLAKALELIARLSKHSVTIPFHYMINKITRQQQLSPYMIVLGEMEENEQLILRSFARKGVDCFKIIENEDAIYLQKASSSVKRGDSYAI
ncbi:DUF58 domain-containing protein [Fredinandcohnia sp. QZ13]|uniref:DUF58 domain-containing protein n=1 Tax=Fredinandcohnia sp. QZ13 TaxID=3073144 RepID=UPI0028533A49|nr:DUF58 domain-containing protein [Fredinandcohnia sp. QZ13]MDR4886696.1 DUF58 domain-containing protein [Fredinandcohnia sp. QZ13]